MCHPVHVSTILESSREADLAFVVCPAVRVLTVPRPLIAPPPGQWAQGFDGDPTDHHPSHEHLVTGVHVTDQRHTGQGLLDLMVVPASRPFAQSERGLRVAVELAHRAGSRLLVLCSKGAQAEEFPDRLLRRHPVPVMLVQLDRMSVSRFLPTLETQSHPFALESGYQAFRDVADKRNLALVFARAAGWSHVLFLDDDVRLPKTDPASWWQSFGYLSVANALHNIWVGQHDVVGWTMTRFPDNSAVCHARRLVGLPQANFIGGGSLVVRVADDTPFYPTIYNEDWLFLYPYLLRGGTQEHRKPVGAAGVIHQAPYDPFAPGRPESEERGDLFAEGLLASLGPGGDPQAVRELSYWSEVVRGRESMVRDVQAQVPRAVEAGTLPSADARRVLGALDPVLQLHRLDRTQAQLAGRCVSYRRAWERDLERWCAAFSQLDPRVADGLLSSPATLFRGPARPWHFLTAGGHGG